VPFVYGFRVYGFRIFLFLYTVEQPSPPSGICDGSQNQDPRCVRKIVGGGGRLVRPSPPPSVNGSTPMPTPDPVQENLNRFCRYREAGIHALPTLCDVFVFCSVGGMASIRKCPNGTKFNPEILGCDHARNYECFIADFNSKPSLSLNNLSILCCAGISKADKDNLNYI